MTDCQSNPPCSHDAQALLLALQLHRGRVGVGKPLTDRELAGRIGVAQRAVIDLAAELIEAGYLVIATCDSSAPGRCLLLPTDDLAPVYQYYKDLKDRGVAVLHRARALGAALRAAERQRNPASNGQLNFALEGS